MPIVFGLTLVRCVMSDVCEKLVVLALASENVDEAVGALRKARQMQPVGKLPVPDAPDWFEFQRERDAFIAERDAFEEERQDFQRRIFSTRKKKRSLKSRWRSFNRSAFQLRLPAGIAAFSLVFLAGTAHSQSSGGAIAWALSLCGLR